jgi:diguanylate cyclase (GGDEF)-like protein
VLLLDRLQHALPMARRHGRHAALMYIDLDHFKRINDTCGHDVGDRFLCVVAARLQESVRATDLVARIGGDEFVVLLEDIGRDRDASLVARKMLRLLAEPMRIGPHTLSAMASIGIGLFPDHAADVETLMRRADSAMYRAKAKGRNAIEVYGAQDDPAQPPRQRTFRAPKPHNK